MGLFRKESMDQLSLQDEKGEYISTTDSRGWLILIALLILFVGFWKWAFTGSLPLSVNGLGYSEYKDETAYIFIDPDEFIKRDIEVGDEVHLSFPDSKSVRGKVIYISELPLSGEEIEKEYEYNDWVVQKVMNGQNYCYVIWINAEEELEERTIFNAEIIEKNVRPIEYFL